MIVQTRISQPSIGGGDEGRLEGVAVGRMGGAGGCMDVPWRPAAQSQPHRDRRQVCIADPHRHGHGHRHRYELEADRLGGGYVPDRSARCTQTSRCGTRAGKLQNRLSMTDRNRKSILRALFFGGCKPWRRSIDTPQSKIHHPSNRGAGAWGCRYALPPAPLRACVSVLRLGAFACSARRLVVGACVGMNRTPACCVAPSALHLPDTSTFPSRY